MLELQLPDSDLDAVEQAARQAAASVDAEARFPAEAVTALKEARELSACLPEEMGGNGLGMVDLTRRVQKLSSACSSTGMVLAMHHIQVASIHKHCGDVPEVRQYLVRLAEEQRLIASATSEVGPSGDLRRSDCAVQVEDGRFQVTKQCTTVSYGQFAEDVLLTCRRNADAAPSDQVAVLAIGGEGLALEQRGSWDTLGMRGTCSPGGVLEAQGAAWQILPEPFGDIAAQTMVPYSHILWAGCWLGIATDAVNRARARVQAAARSKPGQTPTIAHALTKTVQDLQEMRDSVYEAARTYEELEYSNPEKLSSMGYALRINNLKLSVSERLVDMVTSALRICGIMAYKNDSEFSLGRHLRDAHSAALMINNDRIRATNASILLVHKGN